MEPCSFSLVWFFFVSSPYGIVVSNWRKVRSDSTAHELAQQTYTSSSTIVRLCKKLGTKGYPDFQLKLALEYQQMPSTMQTKDHAIAEQGNVLATIDSLPVPAGAGRYHVIHGQH
ncbi:MurR/RpiR family transcriptional regulator [Paenibacillus amylolyticus]|uniref:MurR/RpiR family transcriptional regulator n=1 Tax=Paenibacillus amylolyticus TaxID=1451 RepID=UPI003D978B32